MTSTMPKKRRISMSRWRKRTTRKGDPVTSHEAVVDMTEPTLNANQKAVLEALRRMGGRACDAELVYHYRQNMTDLPMQSESGIRTRRKEMVDAGRVADIGLRTYTKSGRPTIVWSLLNGGK